MRRPIHDSFAATEIEAAPLPLPERGTGLENGNAGERREGNPKTEGERIESHYNSNLEMPKELTKRENHFEKYKDRYYLKK